MVKRCLQKFSGMKSDKTRRETLITSSDAFVVKLDFYSSLDPIV